MKYLLFYFFFGFYYILCLFVLKDIFLKKKLCFTPKFFKNLYNSIFIGFRKVKKLCYIFKVLDFDINIGFFSFNNLTIDFNQILDFLDKGVALRCSKVFNIKPVRDSFLGLSESPGGVLFFFKCNKFIQKHKYV
jgi:hypothetical protein